MSENPKVSIILPVLNGMPWLINTLESIKAQKEEDWVCQAYDRGSQDRSALCLNEMGKSDSRFSYLAFGTPTIASCLNHGLKEVPSVYTLFLSVGDTLHPTALERLIAALESDSGHVGAYGRVCVKDEHGRALARTADDILKDTLRGVKGDRVVDWEGPANLNCFMYRNPAPMPATLFKRSVALEVGGVHPLLEDHLDWNLWMRMSRYGSFVPLGETVVDVREPEEDPDLARLRRRRSAEIVRDEIARTLDLSVPDKQMAERLREVGGLLPS